MNEPMLLEETVSRKKVDTRPSEVIAVMLRERVRLSLWHVSINLRGIVNSTSSALRQQCEVPRSQIASNIADGDLLQSFQIVPALTCPTSSSRLAKETVWRRLAKSAVRSALNMRMRSSNDPSCA